MLVESVETGVRYHHTWSTLSVFHHGSVDCLVREAIAAMATELTNQGHRCFYTRHWRRGPHVRLTLPVDLPTARRLLAPLVACHIEPFLTRHRSHPAIDVATLAARHATLAELEQETGPLQPWQPDGAVVLAPTEDRSSTLGSPAVEALLFGFYQRTTQVALDTVAAFASEAGPGTTTNALAVPALAPVAECLLLAVAQRYCRPLVSAAISFRSHSTATLASVAHPEKVRAWFDRCYAAREGPLRALVRRTHELGDVAGHEVTLVHPVLLALDTAVRGFTELCAHAPEHTPWSGRPHLGEGPRTERLLANSPLHRGMNTTQFAETVASSDWFTAYRFALNLAYLHLYRVGLTGLGRNLICHMLACAVDDEFGTTALDQLAQLAPGRLPDGSGT